MRVTDIDPANYKIQLEKKSLALTKLFTEFATPELEIFPSTPTHYRARAEFRIWHEGDDLFHIMFDPEDKEKYRVDHYLPGLEVINKAMTELLALIRDNSILRTKLYQVDYLSGLSGELLISMIYRKPLNDEWLVEAKELKSKLSETFNLNIIGRARKQKIIIDRDFVIENLPIAEWEFQFKHIENSFTQPNAKVNCKMIEWALSLQKSRKDLLELYCGAGNFTLPLAQNYRRVLATEIAKSSVNAAQFNIEVNAIDNVAILQMSSEELSESLQSNNFGKKFKDVNWHDYDCDTVFVDPPRSGLDDVTLDLVSGFPNIIYISCNPETLKNNLEKLATSHQITRFALFDQFPYTHHAEVGMFLQKRD